MKVSARLRFTPGQLRSTVGLSKETFRHWKRVLPAFASGRGHAPNYSLGDVLASAILRRVTESCGIRIGCFADVATKIFEICNQTSWDVLESDILIVDLPHKKCAILRNPADIPVKNAVLVCPLGPVITELQDNLLRSWRANSKPPEDAVSTLQRTNTSLGRGK